MSFTELNSVEYFILHQLSGVNLNDQTSSEFEVAEPAAPFGKDWKFKSAEQLGRGINEVMVEADVKAALMRLNPEIKAKPELADEVIYRLRAILISVNQIGLVKANEEFYNCLLYTSPSPRDS